jgi:adenylate cyclase
VWIGVMVPQNDFMGDLDRQRNHTLLILAGSLAAAVAMVLLLARGYSTPLRALVLQSQRIESLDLHPPVPVPSRLREVAQLGQAQEKMRGALQSFARYVPTDVVRELIERGEAARIGGRIETLSVLFSDIRGFTSLAESMNPEALMHELADYFNAIQEVLDLHRATLDKFIGDAVLAFWGAPTPNPDHARDAVRAALQCQARLRAFNDAAVALGRPALPTTFGLACGPVVVGNMGASRRLNYSVIGHPVNLASRLQGLNRFYDTDILADKAALEAAGPDFLWRRVDHVVVKGGTGPVEIFEPLGLPDGIPPDRLEFKRVYEAALDACHNRRFTTAMDLLGTIPAAYATNLSVTTLARRCEEFTANPPPANWDTSFRFKDK